MNMGLLLYVVIMSANNDYIGKLYNTRVYVPDAWTLTCAIGARRGVVHRRLARGY